MTFIQNKYTKWYYSIIDNSKSRITSDYTEKHHIVPKCLGGNNSKENLVRLTAREHFVCHWLLIKMCLKNQKFKLLNALQMMRAENYRHSRKRYKTKITSRVYANIKEEHARLRSEAYTGRKDSIETRENKSKAAKNKPPMSKETCKKYREAKLGDKNPMFGKESHRKGKTYEEEFGEERAAELRTIIKNKRSLQIDSKETRAKKSESAKKSHANGVNRFENKQWITNGLINQVILKTDIIQAGWRKGKTMKRISKVTCFRR